MLSSDDRELIRAQLKAAFRFLLRRIVGEYDPGVRERLAFAGNAVRDAARWLAAGGDPSMILLSLSEVSMDDLSPEAAWRIRSVRIVCRCAIAADALHSKQSVVLARDPR